MRTAIPTQAATAVLQIFILINWHMTTPPVFEYSGRCRYRIQEGWLQVNHLLEQNSCACNKVTAVETVPFKAAGSQLIPSDTLAEEDLVEASASPLNRKERDALIQSSLPVTSPKKYRPRTASKR